MSWYYAENNERRGPIEESAFEALVAAGTVRPETLVWREGMPNWQAFSTSGYRRPEAAPQGVPPIEGEASAPRQATEMGVCSESGRILPRSELVEIDGRLVSAEYKNIVLQRIREGVGSLGSSVDPEVLAQQIMARDYHLSAGACISRGWAVMKKNFWLCVGATFLTMLVNQAAGFVPLIGPLIVFGPLTAGLYWMMLRLHRNEPASLSDAFAGFSRSFGHLVGLGAIVFVAMMACMIPGFVGIFASIGVSPKDPPVAGMLIGFLLFGVGFLIMLYLWVSWIFAFPLIIDKQIEFWPAMQLSRKIVGMHWWQVFGVIFLTGLIMLVAFVIAGIVFGLGIAGMIAGHSDSSVVTSFAVLFGIVFLIIMVFLMPLTYATISVAYEDIFGPQPNR